PPPYIGPVLLHDALPISSRPRLGRAFKPTPPGAGQRFCKVRGGDDVADEEKELQSQEAPAEGSRGEHGEKQRPARRTRTPKKEEDRKSTRLNSSHVKKSY